MMKTFTAIIIYFVLVTSVFGQQLKVSSGRVVLHENFPSAVVQPRHVAVWLPEGYDTKKKYAVLYMHDGQMLFDASITWNNQEWEVDETLGRLLAEKQIRDCLVVGVWNAGSKRHSEYFPQKPFEQYLTIEQQKAMLQTINEQSGQRLLEEKPTSDNYLQFLVKELKPFIDKNYATLQDRNNTFVAGSSMGGLISMYAVCEYPEVFGGAACLSTHWPGIFHIENNPIPAAFLAYLNDHLPSSKTHRFYFDYGTATLDALYKPFQQQADIILKKKGYSDKNWITKEFKGEEHSEDAWRRRFHIPVLFLLKK